MRPVPFLDLDALHAEVRADLDRAWHDVRASGVFVGGSPVERFEDEWARYCDRRHAVGVANGTDAIELALRALGVGPGDEVVVPTNTFIATASAVAATGAVPRFVDVDEETLLLTPDLLRAAIGPRTAAVVPVHLYGQLVDMEGILAVAHAAGIAVVEDAAQAHGARRDGRIAGSFADAACFSFYPGKNLGALGDGGAVVTDDAALAERVRSLGDHGRAGSKYVHARVGRNSRLDTLQAAFLLAKLPHLERWNERRRVAAAAYAPVLDAIGVRRVADDPGTVHARHLFVVRVARRAAVLAALARAGIGAGIHYPVPCHLQAPYRTPGLRLRVAEAAADEVCSLPMGPHLSASDVESVAEVLALVASGKELVRG